MKGVKFGSLHSFTEWGLILQKKTIEPAPVKEAKVDIKGSDGQLDYTEAFGTVHYDNRSLSFEFAKLNTSPDAFIALGSVVQDRIHGQFMDITLDDDSGWYYQGRVYVKEWRHEKGYGVAKIEVDTKPYKLKKEVTSVTQTVTGTSSLMLSNSRMAVVPTITTDAPFTFTFGGNTVSAKAGTFKLSDLVLKQGDNVVTVTGNGNVTFEYQEGRL